MVGRIKTGSNFYFLHIPPAHSYFRASSAGRKRSACRMLPSTNRGRRYAPSYQARSSLRACYPAASTLFCHPPLLRPVAADVGVEQGEAYYTFEVNAGDGQARSSRARRTGV